jgi:hypothetical protein
MTIKRYDGQKDLALRVRYTRIYLFVFGAGLTYWLHKPAMGEGYQDLEKSSVCLRILVPSRHSLMRDVVAMKTFPKSSVILMEGRRHLSFCWQAVRDLLEFQAWTALSTTGQCNAVTLPQPCGRR